jgi:hypothetical protein
MFQPLSPGKAAVLCSISVVVAMIVGCGAASPEVSAMTKIATGQVNKLTGAEIQALATKFVPGSSLTSDQADAMANFLAGTQMKTLTDLVPVIKVATGQIDTLTGAEVESLANNVAPDAQLTTQQADAIVTFLADNQVKTMAHLQTLVDQANADPNSVILPDGFEALFAGFDTSRLPTFPT